MATNLDVNEFFKAVYDQGGSDLHMKYNTNPKIRKYGELLILPGYEDLILTDEIVENLAFQTMDNATGKKTGQGSLYGDYLQDGYGLEYAYEASMNGYKYGRWRISYYTSRSSHGFVARLLQDQPKTLEELNAYPTIYDLLQRKKGIIFVTGATGSGKSTLMGAMVDQLNVHKSLNIISLEDPIEMIHVDKKSTVIQRDVGMSLDAASYEKALQSALRQDPDVILIGEIRSIETMKEAFVAANTGHLVITTLHTSSAAETINRILKMYPAHERDGVSQDLAAALIGIISQQLVPAIDGGLTAANEILVNTRSTASIISEGTGDVASLYSIIEKQERGSITFEQYYAKLVQDDVVSLDEAMASVNDIEKFEEAMGVPSNERRIDSEAFAERHDPVTPYIPHTSPTEASASVQRGHEQPGTDEQEYEEVNISESVHKLPDTALLFSDIGEDSEFALDFSSSEPMKFNPNMISSEVDSDENVNVSSNVQEVENIPDQKEQLILRLPKRVVKKKDT